MTQNKARYRLEFLDGIRALAALYVVFYHVYHEIQIRVQGYGQTISPAIARLIGWMGYGHLAVDVFIVLSGFVLMLPVIRANTNSIRSDYYIRRARRILPPYYAALVFSLLIVAFGCRVQSMMGHSTTALMEAFSPGVLLSHLFLVHNLNDAWIYQINSAMWSVATEWQIYFIFPLILLPIWRRTGITVTVISGFAMGVVLHFLFRGHIDNACPWYIGLFAVGMASAQIGFSENEKFRRIRGKWNWPIAIILTLCITAYVYIKFSYLDSFLTVDPLVAIVTACIIIYFCRSVSGDFAGPKPLLLRMFEIKPLVRVGFFSYSLYLVHAPVLACICYLLLKFHLSAGGILLVLVVLGLPVCVGSSYLFHLAFEKRYMSAAKPKLPTGLA